MVDKFSIVFLSCVCWEGHSTCTQVPLEASRRHWIPLELELEAVVSCPVCMLGTEFGPCGGLLAWSFLLRKFPS